MGLAIPVAISIISPLAYLLVGLLKDEAAYEVSAQKFCELVPSFHFSWKDFDALCYPISSLQTQAITLTVKRVSFAATR